MGANQGQVMQWNEWTAGELSSLQFVGNWNATDTNEIIDGNIGDYYIVDTNGDIDPNTGITSTGPVISWVKGVWVLWNDSNTKWERIDKSTASINDISDVDTSGITSDNILIYDGSKWSISDDLIGVVDSTAGSETDKSASVLAMKNYVDNGITTGNTNQFKSNGSVNMIGNFTFDGDTTKTLSVERHTITETPGSNLKISVGGATIGGTDLNGGD